MGKGPSKLNGAKFRELYDLGLSDAAIGRRTNASQQRVNSWRRAAGLPSNQKPRGRPPSPKYDRAELRELYQAGLTDAEMAARMQASATFISHWRKAENLPPNISPHRRPKSGVRRARTRPPPLLVQDKLQQHNSHVKRHPLYRTWFGMLYRCSPNDTSGMYYLRGIRVCERWRLSFAAFANDMGPKPTPKHSIDRIDNSGNYTPENCRWATAKEQANNKGRVDYRSRFFKLKRSD